MCRLRGAARGDLDLVGVSDSFAALRVVLLPLGVVAVEAGFEVTVAGGPIVLVRGSVQPGLMAPDRLALLWGSAAGEERAFC